MKVKICLSTLLLRLMMDMNMKIVLCLFLTKEAYDKYAMDFLYNLKSIMVILFKFFFILR